MVDDVTHARLVACAARFTDYDRQIYWITTLRSGSVTFFAILLIALLIRACSVNFGLPALYDPDEPIFVLSALKLLKSHTLNPGWFGHPGSTTIYALALIDLVIVVLGLWSGRFANVHAFGDAVYHDPTVVFLPGRYFILLCSMIVMLLTYVIARQFFDRRTGLLATALLAVDPLHIHYSQVIRTDLHASVFMLLAIIVCRYVVTRGALFGYMFTGVCVGLATTTKWPAAAVLVSLITAMFIRRFRHHDSIARLCWSLAIAVLFAVGAMFLSSPYLFLDWHTTLADIGGEAQLRHLSTTGGGFWWNACWYIRDPLNNAFGIISLLLIAPGAFIVTRRNVEASLLLLPLTIVFFVALCTQGLIQARWLVPLLPILSIFVAVAAWTIIDRFSRSPRELRVSIAVALIAAILTPPAITARAETIERLHDTRRAATDWARAHIPVHASVTIEYFAFDIVSEPWSIRVPVGDPGCFDVAQFVSAQTPYSKIGKWRDHRNLVDLGTVNGNALESCSSDFVIIDDYDRYIAERDHYPQEISQYRRLLRGMYQVAVFSPQAGVSGGPIVRVFTRDHKTPVLAPHSIS